MNAILQFRDLLVTSFERVVRYPFEPDEHVFLLYLSTSLVLAVAVYVATRPSDPEGEGPSHPRGLMRFLFPAEVWKSRSAWVDVRFFIPHQMVRIWIYGSLATAAALAFKGWCTTGLRHVAGSEPIWHMGNVWTIRLAYTVVAIVVSDFVSYLMHYFQHTVPFLWEFHRVHHSSEVLHPLSNYREHPVDNVSYAVVIGFGKGLVAAVFVVLFGAEPEMFLILGLNIFDFAFNFLGYNLRHSHIWLRWPGVLVYLFGCPAHHQIHHSKDLEHRNRNMAFLFPIWDVIFGTFCVPKTPGKLEFGLGDGTEAEYRSFLTIYMLPFKRLYQKWRKATIDRTPIADVDDRSLEETAAGAEK
jgi:sterol desaturase/sphingolipid hydroxylase (fatty acid hydroxylase superfamily)